MTRNLNDDGGAVAIFVALLLTLFMILAAFALDIGNAYQKVRQQSVAADAAALAAAAKVGDAVPAGTASCTSTLLTTINANSIAQTAADAMNNRNSKSGGEPATKVTVTCEDTGKAIQVRVENHHPVPTSLAGIVGISSINSNSYAVARWVKVSATTGLRPWAVCDGQVTLAQQNKNATFATGLDNKIGLCSSQSNGNWGAVDFNGGGNSAGDLADWTRDGYPDPVTIPGPLPADPGVSNSNQLRDAFISLVNQQVLFPSVSGYVGGGSGNNGTFSAVGVATVEFCGVQYAGKVYNAEADGTPSSCWQTPNQTSPKTATATGTIVTTGKTSTLTISAPNPTSFKLDDPSIVSIDQVVIAGAGKSAAPLTTKFASITSSTVGVLGDQATTDVTNAAVTITYHVSASGAVQVPLDKQGNPVDHIQFRWIDFTSSWTGSGGTTCPWINGTGSSCVPVVGLWQ